MYDMQYDPIDDEKNEVMKYVKHNGGYFNLAASNLFNCWELSSRQSAAKPQLEERSTTIERVIFE